VNFLHEFDVNTLKRK